MSRSEMELPPSQPEARPAMIGYRTASYRYILAIAGILCTGMKTYATTIVFFICDLTNCCFSQPLTGGILGLVLLWFPRTRTWFLSKCSLKTAEYVRYGTKENKGNLPNLILFQHNSDCHLTLSMCIHTTIGHVGCQDFN